MGNTCRYRLGRVCLRQCRLRTQLLLLAQSGTHIVFGEEVLGQKVNLGNLKARGNDDDVGLEEHVLALGFLLLAALAQVECNAVLAQVEHIPAVVVGLALADVLERRRVDDGRVDVEALGGRHLFLEAAVVELAEEQLGDEREPRLAAKRLQGEQRIDDRGPRDDPLVGACQDRRLLGPFLAYRY